MNDQAHHEVVELLTRIGDHLEAIQAESRAARGAEQEFRRELLDAIALMQNGIRALKPSRHGTEVLPCPFSK
jgi:Flp pilus assembly protein TadD